jgi:enamine deaminase RidA (YjgF/YER057c/UK114 family)
MSIRLIANWSALSAFWIAGGFAQTIQYIVPDAMPSLPYSFGVMFPNEIKTIDVSVTARGTKFNQTGIPASAPPASSLKGQMQQALANLDTAMHELHSSKMDIAKLNIKFAGYSYDQVQMLGDLLEEYFIIRNTSKELRYPPVRTLVGMESLGDEKRLVEIDATLFDPKSKPEMLMNQGIEIPDDYGTHGSTLLIGGITAMNKSHVVKGLNSMRTQAQTSLEHMDLVLSQAGASRGDVKAIHVFYTPKPGTDAGDRAQAEKLLREELKKYFGDNTEGPKVTLQADVVNCSPYLRVLVDAQASVRARPAPKA